MVGEGGMAAASAQDGHTVNKESVGDNLTAAKATNLAVKVGDVCPKCGQGTVIRGKTALGCSRWREGCDFRMPL